eukprot:GHVR01048359.1.p1 GENE.GHVR01048359.1~~GHVR01048359.1.p1  ORF type:complete len:270 (+),score=36.32 GHVR01048359.1:543-1352(+)
MQKVVKERVVPALRDFSPTTFNSLKKAPRAVAEYPKDLFFVPYEEGTTSAQLYPNRIIPVEQSITFPLELFAFDSSKRNYNDRQTHAAARVCLSDRLFGRVSVIIISSASTTSRCLDYALKWQSILKEEEYYTLKKDGCQLVNLLYCPSVSLLFMLPSVSAILAEISTTFNKYNAQQNFLLNRLTGKQKKSLLVYSDEIPSVLLVDSLCRIRWHCLGSPTTAASRSLIDSTDTLLSETRNRNVRVANTHTHINSRTNTHSQLPRAYRKI